ncbi:MAG: phage major capsid protein [Clostridia bacterium]|nr:phage major capsid protein [Clostridia bacterium]
MVTLETAEKALKSVYLNVVADQLNVGVNPLLAKIEQTSSDVWGKEIIKLVPYGINGGIGAGTETGELPTPAANNYDRFKLELKNLYGTIELSDKAIRASQSNTGAFVNLLNAEMEGLLKASKFNLGRMLYGDGSGTLAICKGQGGASNVIALDSVRNVMEGMVVDVYSKTSGTAYGDLKGVRIVSVDRANNTVTLSANVATTVADGDILTVQGSKENELTGLGAIFSDRDLYGLSRKGRSWLAPKQYENVGSISTAKIQSAIDYIDEVAGSQIDFIVCSYDVRRAYLDYLALTRTNVDYMNLDGGFKALSYNGIPLIADRFVESGTMYLLNSKDFKLHQLCDWRWLEGDNGKVIKQKAGSATYGATLVKYADMICDKPIGQAKLSGITCS